MESKLKKCPFCGGNAEVEMTVGRQYAVACSECDCNLANIYNTEDEAIVAWNCRAIAEE